MTDLLEAVFLPPLPPQKTQDEERLLSDICTDEKLMVLQERQNRVQRKEVISLLNDEADEVMLKLEKQNRLIRKQKKHTPTKISIDQPLFLDLSNISSRATTPSSLSPKSGHIIQLTSPIVMRMTGSTPNTTPQKRSNQERSPLLDDEHNDSFTSSEKRQRELEESEKLAWQLMEEESMNAYQIQVDYMRNHPELFDAADLAALGAVLNDNTNSRGHENEEEGDDNVSHSEENNNEVQEENSADWTYEQLLELGRTIGDVKTDRWKMRSADIISCLPRSLFQHFVEAKKSSTGVLVDTESCCTVCMDCYQVDQQIIELPCSHFFHTECSEMWLKENNSCPLCKSKITSSP